MNQKPTIKSTIKAFLYLAPMLIIVGIFNLYPIVKSFFMSVWTDYNFYTDKVSARGLDNFIYIFKDPDFHKAVLHTFEFVGIVVPLTIMIALAIALGLSKLKFLQSLFRTIYFLPFVTSTVAVSMVWNWIYNGHYGFLNWLLGLVGIHPIQWLSDPKYAMISLSIMAIWQGLGFNVLLFLVALNNVDSRYYKVAQIDGASAWQQFVHVTVPLISPITLLVSINAVISSFKVFDAIYALFGGRPGPVSSASTIVFYLYQKFYEQNQYGVAAASGVILFFIILMITLFQLWFSKRHTYYVSGSNEK
jgi:multiple sugar transport system permease protein